MTDLRECRDVYEADIRARIKRSGFAVEPYLKTNADGTYRRADLEADYQSFRASWFSRTAPPDPMGEL